MTTELRPGTLVSPSVRLVRPLGEGNMGRVWVADHLGLETQVAVKFMSAELGSDPATRARFAREAVAASRVKSPHVVQTFDHGVTAEGVPFIVMELLEGEDLATRMGQGLLSLAQTSAITSQVCLALARAHAMGVVHRDIKPANIFLCDVGGGQPFVKLLDFGIAKTVHQPIAGYATSVGVPMGTPYYMSPEQFVDASQVDARSDLWSLGVVVYECVTGVMPFGGASLGALIIAVSHGTFELPSAVRPELPKVFDEWCQVALAKKPDDRFQSAKALAERLAAVAAAPARGLGSAKMASLPPGSDLAHGVWPSTPTLPHITPPVDSSVHVGSPLVDLPTGPSLADLGKAATIVQSESLDHTLPAAAREGQTARNRLHATTGAAGAVSSEQAAPAAEPPAAVARPRRGVVIGVAAAVLMAPIGAGLAWYAMRASTHGSGPAPSAVGTSPAVRETPSSAPPPKAPEPTATAVTTEVPSTSVRVAASNVAPSNVTSATVAPIDSATPPVGHVVASASASAKLRLPPPAIPSAHAARPPTRPSSGPPAPPPPGGDPSGLDGLTGMGLK